MDDIFLEKPEKLLNLSHKEIYQRVYALEKTLEHLSKALDDPRKRERERTRIALQNLHLWLRMGEIVYDRGNYNQYSKE